MPDSLNTASNVIVGLAQLSIAPDSTAAPTFATTGLVTPLTTPWVPAGFTETGVTLNVDRKSNNIMVEEQSTPILVVSQSLDVTIDISFAEDTIANMVNAYGGGTVTTVAPAAGIPGTTTLTLSDLLEVVAVCFIGTNAFGLQRLVYVPRMVSAGKVKTDYVRAKANRSYPTTFTAICAPEQISIKDATAAGT